MRAVWYSRRSWSARVAVLAFVAKAVWGAPEFGVTARNQAGDSPRASESGHVEIAPDMPPGEWFTATLNPGTPLEGVPGWYDVFDWSAGTFSRDFRREFGVRFDSVLMSFPVALRLRSGTQSALYPSPKFEVEGMQEADRAHGKKAPLGRIAFYVSGPVQDGTVLRVIDHMRTAFVPRPRFGIVMHYDHVWSLCEVGSVEPVAMTSSLLFKLTPSLATAETTHGLVVPWSGGGEDLGEIENSRPVFSDRLRALYLHKPAEMKASLWWDRTSGLKLWHTPYRLRTDGEKYFENGAITNGHVFVDKDSENPVFVEVTATNAGTVQWGFPQANHSLMLLPVDLAVDANRDGFIKFAGNAGDPEIADREVDRTTQRKPFSFWVNDDQDTASGDKVPIEKPDHEDGVIASERDLEDFTRITVFLGPLAKDVASGLVVAQLAWKNTASTHPVINVYGTVTNNVSDFHIINTNAAANQVGSGLSRTLGAVSVETPLSLRSAISEDALTAPARIDLLFEGAQAGKGQLVLLLSKNGETISEGPGLWMDLRNIKTFYERAQVTLSDTTPPFDYIDRQPPEPEVGFVSDVDGGAFEPAADEDLDDKTYIAFVHGWNMTKDETYDFSETMFKRIWWRGYKGRFAAVRWPTYATRWTPSDRLDAVLSKYNESEYIAWKSGKGIKKFVESLPTGYTRNLVAHSMGNIAAGSALKEGLTVKNYAMLHAAVPASCYDTNPALKPNPITVTNELLVKVESTYWDEPTPDDDLDEKTKALAYKGKLTDIDATLVNFALPEDAATTVAWQCNNELYKPDKKALWAEYTYEKEGPPGYKLSLRASEVVPPLGTTTSPSVSGSIERRTINSPHEAFAFASRSSTQAVGSDTNARGKISDDNIVDLSQPVYGTKKGFDTAHSAEFVWPLGRVMPFYRELMRRLQITQTREE